MKFLLLSRYADGANWLYKMKQEGNEVALHIDSKNYKDAWDGIIPKLDKNWENFVDSDTTVLFDTTGLGDKADYLRRKGIATWGGSELSDKLEKDRVFGLEFAKKAGLLVPEYFEFKNVEHAKQLIQANPDTRWVFKPSGRGEVPTKLTYVSDDNDDLSSYLDFVQDVYSECASDFILQEFKEGVDVSTEAFCCDKKFIEPFNHTIEAKNFMDGEKGPSTGCSGNIVWPIEGSDYLYENGLKKLEEFCNFYCQIDENCILDEEGKVWFLEHTPRRGYDASPTLDFLMLGDSSQLYYDLARGNCSVLPITQRMVGSVRVSVPPYPTEIPEGVKLEVSKKVAIKGVPSKYKEHYYFYEVMKDKKLGFVHSGGDGVIMIVIDSGYDPEECLTLPYEILDKIKIPDAQYRTDLVEVLTEELDKFNELHDSISNPIHY